MNKHSVSTRASIQNKLYEVDSIIDMRIQGSKEEYKVKWKDYPIEDCTWEPIEHLANATEALEEFKKNIKGTQKLKEIQEAKKSKPIRQKALQIIDDDLSTLSQNFDETIDLSNNNTNSASITKEKHQIIIPIEPEDEFFEITDSGYTIKKSALLFINRIKELNGKMYALISFQYKEGRFITIKHDSIETKKLAKLAPLFLLNYYESNLKF